MLITLVATVAGKVLHAQGDRPVAGARTDAPLKASA